MWVISRLMQIESKLCTWLQHVTSWWIPSGQRWKIHYRAWTLFFSVLIPPSVCYASLCSCVPSCFLPSDWNRLMIYFAWIGTLWSLFLPLFFKRHNKWLISELNFSLSFFMPKEAGRERCRFIPLRIYVHMSAFLSLLWRGTCDTLALSQFLNENIFVKDLFSIFLLWSRSGGPVSEWSWRKWLISR